MSHDDTGASRITEVDRDLLVASTKFIGQSIEPIHPQRKDVRRATTTEGKSIT